MKRIKIEISGNHYEQFKKAIEDNEQFEFSLSSKSVKIEAECAPMSTKFHCPMQTNDFSTIVELIELKKM